MIDDKFCERLTELRLKAGISARDMSLSIGQNAGYVNQIENKRMYPSMEMFFAICDYFKISPMEYFNYAESPIILPENHRKFFNNLSKLSEEEYAAFSLLLSRIINTNE